MAQLNLYVSEALAVELKQRAERKGVSLSSYVVHQLSQDAAAPGAWPGNFFEDHCGFLQENLEAPADPAPDAVILDAE